VPRRGEAVCPEHRAGRCPGPPSDGASARGRRSRQGSWAHDVTAESPRLLRRRPTAVAAGALLVLVPFGLLTALLQLFALLLAFGLVPGVVGLLVLRTLLLVTIGGLLIVGGLVLRILVLSILVVGSLLLGLLALLLVLDALLGGLALLLLFALVRLAFLRGVVERLQRPVVELLRLLGILSRDLIGLLLVDEGQVDPHRAFGRGRCDLERGFEVGLGRIVIADGRLGGAAIEVPDVALNGAEVEESACGSLRPGEVVGGVADLRSGAEVGGHGKIAEDQGGDGADDEVDLRDPTQPCPQSLEAVHRGPPLGPGPDPACARRPGVIAFSRRYSRTPKTSSTAIQAKTRMRGTQKYSSTVVRPSFFSRA